VSVESRTAKEVSLNGGGGGWDREWDLDHSRPGPSPFDVATLAPGAATQEEIAARVRDGATWLLEGVGETTSNWGSGAATLWSRDEPFLVYGPDGVGKTGVVQQLILHAAGIRRGPFLGATVESFDSPSLYLALDRPKQARRSLARMVTEADYDLLAQRLLVWAGPLPFDIGASPRKLPDLVESLGCGRVYIDGLKDAALDLVKDEVGARVNLALQECVARGIDACVLHHPRKDAAGAPDKPKTLEDVYGSRWIVAGMGSVLLIWGRPGDPVVELSHLKQPAEEYSAVKVLHDHERGVSTLYEQDTLENALARAAAGLTVAKAAEHLYPSDRPADRERARRRLEALVRDGHATRRDDPDGTARYYSRPEGA
jgi:replicative DNA helicase